MEGGKGWRLQVLVPGFLKDPVAARARDEGLSVSAWVGAVLAHAVGYDEALRELRPWWAERRLRIQEALKLLERALAVPIRPDGVYAQAELAGHLGLNPATLSRWRAQGVLPGQVSPDGEAVLYRGSEVLLLLLGQSAEAVQASVRG